MNINAKNTKKKKKKREKFSKLNPLVYIKDNTSLPIWVFFNNARSL